MQKQLAARFVCTKHHELFAICVYIYLYIYIYLRLSFYKPYIFIKSLESTAGYIHGGYIGEIWREKKRWLATKSIQLMYRIVRSQICLKCKGKPCTPKGNSLKLQYLYTATLAYRGLLYKTAPLRGLKYTPPKK